jgi:ubiquinone/menaquinone biosynthesis C-methylase UbiE
LLVIALAVAGSLPLKVPRQVDREGPEVGDAVTAYNDVSTWFMFVIERWIILNILSKNGPEGVLVDVGCGPGFLAAQASRRFPGLKVIGLDISEEMLALARRNWGAGAYRDLELINGNAQHLPFADGALDCLVSSLSIHHWTDAPMAFREFKRVLKPGGRLLLLDLRRDCTRSFYWALALGQMVAPEPLRRTNGAIGSFWASYTIAEMSNMLDDAGFSTGKIERGWGWFIATGKKQ